MTDALEQRESRDAAIAKKLQRDSMVVTNVPPTTPAKCFSLLLF